MAEREKAVQRISPAQVLSVIMYYTPCISHPKQMSAPIGTVHVDSKVAVGACLLSAQLGIAHLVKVLSFISLLPDLGLQKHILSISQGLSLFHEAAPAGTCCWLTQSDLILRLLYSLAYYTAFTSFNSPQ